MANLESFGTYSELSKYYRLITKEVGKIEKLFREREKEISDYYKNLRQEALSELVEKAKKYKETKKYRSLSNVYGKMDRISKELIEYKDAILAEWREYFCENEELYCYLEYLKNEQKKFKSIVDQGILNFNRNVTQAIIKDYIFEKIHNYDELISYMNGLKQAKETLEQKNRQESDQKICLKLQAELFSVLCETEELSIIVDIINNCREILGTEFFDQKINKLSNEIYKEYREMMIERYLSKRSMDAYASFYDREIVDNKNVCITLERIAAEQKI